VVRFSPFRWLSPAGSSGRLSIFIFHRVLARVDPLRPGEPDEPRFERIVEFLVRNFSLLALRHALGSLQEGTLPSAAACITFDDGYADNLTLAAPILRRHGAPATVFVATGFSGGGRMFNDTVIESVRALPCGDADWRQFNLGQHRITDDASRLELIGSTLRDLKYRAPEERTALAEELARSAGLHEVPALMMSPSQIVEWRDSGFEVGGHTVNHPILARLDDARAAAEISAGRDQLRQWLGEAPDGFAYPNGVPGRDYSQRDVDLVKRVGYLFAVSTARGAAARHVDPYQLPRFTPWDRSMWRFGLRCAQTLLEAKGRAGEPKAIENNTEVHP
jgi:peptidoglycan/xylan/chitin deacetylase (PgdA/CDA1 family)